MGRPRNRVKVKCQTCGGEFEVQVSVVKSGGGKYCSRECYHAGRAGVTRGPYGPNRIVEERECRVCGNTFLVGGRGRPPKTQQLCSDACQRASRYRRGSKAKDFSAHLGWVAGLIDGEGSIMLHPRRDAVALRLTVSNSHRPTLERFVELTGIGAVIWNTKTGEGHKPAGWWLVNGEAAESVLRQALPEIFTKRQQADLAIAFQERLRTPALKADRSWQLEHLERMRRLNKRGR